MAIVVESLNGVLVGRSTISGRVHTISCILSLVDGADSSSIALGSGLWVSESAKLWQVCVLRIFRHLAKP
jgi:hypothetical protein